MYPMIHVNLKATISVALICFVLGICSACMLMGGCYAPRRALVNIQEQQQAHDSIKKVYAVAVDSLVNINEQLTTRLHSLSRSLQATKIKTAASQQKIKTFLTTKGYPGNKLVEQVRINDTGRVQTTAIPCDSLVKEVTHYLVETEQQHHLYEATISTQQAIIQVKEAIIVTQTDQLYKQDSLFTASLQNQSLLIRENKQLHKKIKRKKFKNTVVTIGLAVLAGFTLEKISR